MKYPQSPAVFGFAVCAVALGLTASCAKRVTSLPAGPITISGHVNDAAGLPLASSTVRLSRGSRYLEATTDAMGAYAFPSLASASYELKPKMHECHFLPKEVDLDNLASSRVENFGGYGEGCGGDPTVNIGAMSGPLAISGHVRDASGQPIVGARIELEGETPGIRFTDLTGGYVFHVERDDYEIEASGACTMTPSGEVHKKVNADAVQDFVGGPGCTTATTSNKTATGSVLTIRQGATVLGTTYVRIQQLPGPPDAVARLSEIAAEQAAPTKSVTIAGNSAIERQMLVTLPGPGPEITGNSAPPAPFMVVTTAIAVGSAVVRFESQLSGQADAATVTRFVQLGRDFTPAAIPDLHGPVPPSVPMTHNTPPGPAPVAPGITAPGVFGNSAFGELELAASDTANVVVYGSQNGPFFSTDGGQTVKTSTYNTVAAPPAAAFVSLGDPTVTVGSPNASFKQTIYFAQLEQAAPPPAPGNNPTTAVGLYQSTDDGLTFNSAGFPVNCSNAAAGCVVPDQEHLIADRVNRAVTAAGSFDQLYLAWRNFTSATTNAHTVGVACSQDGGANWTTDLTTVVATGVDFPKISVGPDGSFLVAYSISSGATYSLQVQKWSSCASGFQPSPKAATVKSVTEVTDMPGLDRTPFGNYAPAFDDSDGSAQTIFVVYANEASAGNDDIHVAESRDGGTTWARDSIVSTVGTGRKFFPWICSTVGKKFVTWYDRRGGTTAAPDLTAYFRSSVFDNASASSVGIGPEINVSGVNDAQCAPGFSNGVRGAIEETGCPSLPAGFIQGGTCQCAPGNTPPPACGGGAACDFRAAAPCANPRDTCQPAPGAGVPKYGDYNGAACALGTLYTAWASATPPKGGAICIVAGLPSPSAAKCCSGFLSGGTCAPTAAACTANGGACGPGLNACCSSGLNGQCQAGVCLPGIALYTGSSCLGPGCAGIPVTITYHQVGACNGYVGPFGAVSVGPNAAYVIFGIERIDNSLGSSAFNFDPRNVFVQQATQDFFDPNLALYTDVLGPFAAVATTLAIGDDRVFAVSGQGALVVSTTTTDGSIEANQTKYFLQYNRQPTDPPVTLIKSDAARTSWPVTADCKTIVLN